MTRYKVRLKRQLNDKTVFISASSETNARYEAERQNTGWTAIDVQRA